MAESQAKPPSLEEEYSLVKPEDKPNTTDIEEKSTTTTEDKTETVTTDSVQEEKLPEATVETVTEEEKLPEETTEEKTTEETNPVVEEENTEESEEEKPEIKIETAPADFRFPTTNQTRHCFTRYVEYHKCVAAKGEDAPECDKFAKYYRSLCPSEWVERWNEQRENGTFPGPL